jgi:hypothetical protein
MICITPHIIMIIHTFICIKVCIKYIIVHIIFITTHAMAGIHIIICITIHIVMIIHTIICINNFQL